MSEHIPGRPQLSQRAQSLPPSGIRSIVLRAAQLEAEGRRLLRLDIGNLDLPMPERISAGIKQALDSGQVKYSAAEGIRPFREALAGHLLRRFPAAAQRAGLDAAGLYPLVTASQGGTQALNAVIQLLADRGENILLPEIAWPNYVQQFALAGILPRFYELDAEFLPDPRSIEALINPQTRALLINLPGNPAGAVGPPALTRELCALTRAHGLWLIADDSYCDLVFEGETLCALEDDWAQAPEARNVFSVFSCSKSFAAPGLRLGYVVSPSAASAARLGLLNDPLMGCLTTPLQYGMIAGMAQEDSAARIEQLRPRWRRAAQLLQAAQLNFVQPRGGLFYFVDISPCGLSSAEFALRLLEERGVAVIPGSGFGVHPHTDSEGRLVCAVSERADSYVRLCFTVNDAELEAGILELGSFVQALQREAGAASPAPR